MMSKSIVASIFAMKMISAGNCPKGAFTMEYLREDNRKVTFPINPDKCNHGRRYSIKFECYNDMLRKHKYSDNNCQNKVNTTLIAVGETFPDGYVKLDKLECSNACNCDHIELLDWEVPKDQVCGEAKGHMDDILAHLIPRESTFRCIKAGTKSMKTEIDGCTPKKTTMNGKYGTVGRNLMYNNTNCAGDPFYTQEIEIMEPNDKGVIDIYDPNIRNCRSVAPGCSPGMNHAGVEENGIMIQGDIPTCEGGEENAASQVSIRVAIVSLIFSIISLF